MEPYSWDPWQMLAGIVAFLVTTCSSTNTVVRAAPAGRMIAATMLPEDGGVTPEQMDARPTVLLPKNGTAYVYEGADIKVGSMESKPTLHQKIVTTKEKYPADSF